MKREVVLYKKVLLRIF